jgi:phage I-like protein
MAATEFRLFTFGENPTEKGTFVVERADALACVKAWQARGTDLALDYEHDVTREGFGPRPAAGWCGLEVRSDGLWAVGVRWTATAQKLIDAKEYRYFSPLFEHTDDKHVRNIINIALTNTPATHGIAPLVAAALRSRRGVRGQAQEIPRGPAAPITQRGRTGLSRSTMDPEEKKAMQAALAEMQEQCKAMAAKLAAEDDPKPKDEEGDDKKDAVSAAAALCALTGEKNPLAALAKLVGKSEPAEGETVASRVALAVSEGKLPPALKSVAESWSHEQLASYLAQTKAVPTRTNGAGAKPGQNGQAGPVSLSAADKMVAKNLNIPEAKFLEQKQRLAAQQKGQG